MNLTNSFYSYVFGDIREMSIDEKKNVIHKMIDILDDDQLTNVIRMLETPYFNKKLNEYLNGNDLPSMNSPEFLFLIEVAKCNGNIVRKRLINLGISNYYINKFIFKYDLEEVSAGIYIFPGKPIDSQFLFQAKYRSSVISHETALYLHDLSDVIPKSTFMSFPMSYNFSQLNKGARDSNYIRIEMEIDSETGIMIPTFFIADDDPIKVLRNNLISAKDITFKENYYGNKVRVTSPERTIADIFKSNWQTEEEVKYESLRRYIEKNPGREVRLLRIGKGQGVDGEIKRYLKFI